MRKRIFRASCVCPKRLTHPCSAGAVLIGLAMAASMSARPTWRCAIRFAACSVNLTPFGRLMSIFYQTIPRTSILWFHVLHLFLLCVIIHWSVPRIFVVAQQEIVEEINAARQPTSDQGARKDGLANTAEMHGEREPMTREEFQDRQDRRRERLENAAANARQESTARLGAADKIADAIPFGQPILVGHHSERGHRRDIARIETNMRKEFEAAKAADDFAERAASVGSGGVSSDDPDAIEKLEARVAKLEDNHARMKSANALVRKQDRTGLAAAGYTEEEIEGLFTPDFAGRLGFPSYAITNNSANIRRIRDRIAYLRKMSAQAALAPIVGQGWTITDDVDENRVLIAFDEKPDRTMLDALKAAGFRWSPTRNAHVRQRSNRAIWAAKHVLGVKD